LILKATIQETMPLSDTTVTLYWASPVFVCYVHKINLHFRSVWIYIMSVVMQCYWMALRLLF